MQINFTYDQAQSSLPTGMVQALDIAASYLDHLFANPITINIEVGYGEITQDGQTTPVTSGAEGGPDFDDDLTYAALRDDYAANLTSPDQYTAYANMPAANLTDVNQFAISSAEGKAWGLLTADDDIIDGSVGFQEIVPGGRSALIYDFNPFDRAVGDDWDFIGAALHEITHAMGRVSDLGYGGEDSLLDLFRYSAPGVLQQSATGSPAYFSIDGGETNLGDYDTTDTDPSDWATGHADDSADLYGLLGVANDFGQTDLRELNVIGFQRLAQTDDFEGKGTSDLIWQDNSTGASSEWQFENGAKTGTISLGTQASYQIVATGDFNGDGTTDLLWQDPTSGDTWAWLMNDGQMSQAIQYGDLQGWRETVGDFTGNGTSGIVWQDSSSGAIWEWIMAGGEQRRSIFLGNRPNWSIVGSGDFNGDGTTDLLMVRPNGRLFDWIMSSGRLDGSNFLGNVSEWTYLGSGDFTGSLTTDLLWRNNSTNDVQEWLMSNGVVGSKVDLGVVAGSNVVATGDYWGTGTSDIVWQNTATGATTIWAMLNGQHDSAYDVNLGSTSGSRGI